MVRAFLMILFVTCTTISGQLLLKRAVTEVAERVPGVSGLQWLMVTFMSPLVWAAVVIQGVGFIVWVVVISKLKLGVAFALAGASLYILMALVAWLLHGERLAPVQWAGLMLISCGVLMVSKLGQAAA
ncbi:hypothetical protein [Luteimonas sp. MC1572]|uniref:hypothetical protein n=1 Tax=Luteimonas sp. MC1572 TaxID=2799325 RepID=UPI0018F05F85|nr:hypothetical protein [Luteimonas sp. MC1572]MBJ6981371.1 hypothetical protein [Luteimonas sp. MC1572]QQO02684.1 hypothetical protein JGR64_10960 [Luteimonas sp. MC1572]